MVFNSSPLTSHWLYDLEQVNQLLKVLSKRKEAVYEFVPSASQFTLTTCFLSLGTWEDTKMIKALEAGEGTVMKIKISM